MSKSWQPYAQHILDAIAKIQRIQARGDLTQDEVLYPALYKRRFPREGRSPDEHDTWSIARLHRS
jgi:hypothetical protein